MKKFFILIILFFASVNCLRLRKIEDTENPRVFLSETVKNWEVPVPVHLGFWYLPNYRKNQKLRDIDTLRQWRKTGKVKNAIIIVRKLND